MNKKNLSIKEGFTLIELSIVMIIIGLIIGAIMAGSELIDAARVRNVVTEISEINTSINTFKLKYDYLPGDFPRAGALWTSATCPNSLVSAGCNGNGNGIVNTGSAPIGTGSEELRFWQHLSLAGMISGNYNGVTAVANQGDIGTILPRSKYSSKAGYYVSYEKWGAAYAAYTSETSHYLTLGAFRPNNPRSYNALLTPIDAYNIDLKIDNGMPISGKVLAAFPSYLCSTGTSVNSTYSFNITRPVCIIGIHLGI